MFVSPLARVLAVIVSEGKNTDVSPAVCRPLIHSSYSQLSVSALSCVFVRDKPLPPVPSREHNSTNNDAFPTPLPACWSSDFKAKKHNGESKPRSVCIYLPVSVTIRRIGVCVAAVIGPLCSASGPSLIFITRFINKQINRDTFLERMKEAGAFLSLKITFLYIYI